jgi:hypothetical protein
MLLIDIGLDGGRLPFRALSMSEERCFDEVDLFNQVFVIKDGIN